MIAAYAGHAVSCVVSIVTTIVVIVITCVALYSVGQYCAPIEPVPSTEARIVVDGLYELELRTDGTVFWRDYVPARKPLLPRRRIIGDTPEDEGAST